MRPWRPMLAALIAALALYGCASAPLFVAMDAMSVAEMGKTSYDMGTGLSTKRIVRQDDSSDAQAEARLRAALDAQGGLLKYATAQVSGGRGFVVGVYADRAELSRARAATQGIKGLTNVTLCLYQRGSGRARVGDGELRETIGRMAGIKGQEFRLHVVEGNALFIGQVGTRAEAERLRACALRAGAASVQDHLLVAGRS